MGWFLKFMGVILLVLNLGLATLRLLAGSIPAVADMLPSGITMLLQTLSIGWAIFLAIFGSIWPVLFFAVGEIYDTTQAMKAKLDRLDFEPEPRATAMPEPAPHPPLTAVAAPQPVAAAALPPEQPYIPAQTPAATARPQPVGPLPSRRTRQP